MEQTDLASKENSRALSMRDELGRWLHSVVDSLNGKDYPAN
jgi:hypothetical protein